MDNGSSFLSVKKFTEGVPQGEVLSPVLFVLYAADLLGILEYCGVVYKQFAADLKICRRDYSKIQFALNKR